MPSQALMILRGIAKPRPSTTRYYIFLVGWSRRSLNNGQSLILLCYVIVEPRSALQLRLCLSPCLLAEVMVPIEVLVPSANLAVTSKISNSCSRIYDVEALDEKRQNNGYLTKDRSVELTTN